MESETSTITLVSSDGEKFVVSREIGNMSQLIHDIIEDHGDDDEIEDIPVTTVQSNYLREVIDYCTHYNFTKTKTDIQAPLSSTSLNQFIKDPWEQQFIKKFDQDAIIDLLMAVNYLNIPAIYELCCATIAAEFKGKSFDEIKNQYGLGDVTYGQKEEEEIKKLYPWIVAETESKIKLLREQ